jgi:hypothetical protein
MTRSGGSCVTASAPPRSFNLSAHLTRRKYDVDNCNHSETASNIEGRSSQHKAGNLIEDSSHYRLEHSAN